MSTTKIKALKPPKSVFNLSYEKKFDFDMGQLIPICCEEMVPGDYFKIGNEIVIRFQPMFAPVLQEINAYVHYFFVPTRLLWEYWEDFITGGEDGLDSHILPRFSATFSTKAESALKCGLYSPYDYFGFPVLTDSDGFNRYPGDSLKAGGLPLPGSKEYGYRPLAFPWRAMNLVWNEYYRDENLQDVVDLDNPYLLYRNWHKDYFTSALEAQQRGIAPALSMHGLLPVHLDEAAAILPRYAYADDDTIAVDDSVYVNNTDNTIGLQQGQAPLVADLESGAGIDVSELRAAFQVQKWMERNMRAGVRYTSFLHAHYSVSPRDDRLQRPEYLGGSKSPIIVSEVLQTSQASGQTTPTGSLYGRGITADKNYCCSYHAKEFGYLIGFLSVMPKATYQQGIDRQWLRKSRFDFFSPEFSHLSEQELTTEELFSFYGDMDNGDEAHLIGNDYIFGYQARYNEMRANKSKVCGSMRDTLDYWHLGRKFDTVPQLNSDFIACDPSRDDLKRIFQVQDVPGLICNFANIITAVRPLPKFGEPGLIDHD